MQVRDGGDFHEFSEKRAAGVEIRRKICFLQSVRVYYLNPNLQKEETMAAVVNKDECTGCETCVETCPVGAIEMKDGAASVKADECIDCGACAGACPVSAITVE